MASQVSDPYPTTAARRMPCPRKSLCNFLPLLFHILKTSANTTIKVDKIFIDSGTYIYDLTLTILTNQNPYRFDFPSSSLTTREVIWDDSIPPYILDNFAISGGTQHVAHIRILLTRCYFIHRSGEIVSALGLWLRHGEDWLHMHLNKDELWAYIETLLENRGGVYTASSYTPTSMHHRKTPDQLIMPPHHSISPTSLHSVHAEITARTQMLHNRLTSTTQTTLLKISILTIHQSLERQNIDIIPYLKIWEADLPAHNAVSFPSPISHSRLGRVAVTHYHVYSNGFMQRFDKTVTSSQISGEFCKVVVEEGRYKIWSGPDLQHQKHEHT